MPYRDQEVQVRERVGIHPQKGMSIAMDELMEKLQEILSSEEGQSQLKSVASMFGMGDTDSEEQAEQQQASQGTGGGLDMGSLTQMLSAMGGNNSGSSAESTTQQAPQGKGDGFDMGTLTQMLSAMGGNNSDSSAEGAPKQASQGAGGFDMGSLTQMMSAMGGSQPGNQTKGDALSNVPVPAGDSQGNLDLGGIDINMLLKVQQMVSNMNTDDPNTRLLQALKPHVSDSRKEKVDKAIKMMKLFSLLPLIQESGVLGNLLGGMFGNGGK